MAQLYINDVLALNITQNRVVVAAPLESGFHKVAARVNFPPAEVGTTGSRCSQRHIWKLHLKKSRHPFPRRRL